MNLPTRITLGFTLLVALGTACILAVVSMVNRDRVRYDERLHATYHAWVKLHSGEPALSYDEWLAAYQGGLLNNSPHR